MNRNRVPGRLAACLLVSVLAAPAVAADLYSPPPFNDVVYAPREVVGHLDLAYGLVRQRVDDGVGWVGEFDERLFRGAGRANIPFAADWNVEVELSGDAYVEDGGASQAFIAPVAHLWKRHGAGAFGVFGGAQFGGGAVLGIVGAEAEVEAGERFTAGGQYAYYFGPNENVDWSRSLARAWASFYFTPDMKLRGEFRHAWDRFAGDSTVYTHWTASGELEHRFSGKPLSVFASLGYTRFGETLFDVSEWKGLVGARIFVDRAGTTLREHDRQVPWDIRHAKVENDGGIRPQ